MFGAHGGFQPPNQNGFNPAQARNGPPPAKRAKNNPVITRYPPPPGYRPPPHLAGQFQQNAWQQPNAPYNYGQQAYPGYPSQPYGQPQQSQVQNQWQGHFQPPSNRFPPGYYPPQTQTWPAPTPSWHSSTPSFDSSQPQGWPSHTQATAQTGHAQPCAPTSAPPSHASRHNSVSLSIAGVDHADPTDGNGDPLPPPSPHENTAHELEEDFYSECYFLRHPDEIDSRFSLGELEWRPASITRLALPSTFKEAEIEVIAPRRPPPMQEKSPSEYLTLANREEALYSVRQTDEWPKVKDDVIFKEFPAKCSSILSKTEMLNKFKDRIDPNWQLREPSMTPEPAVLSKTIERSDDTVGGAMEVDESYTADHDARSHAPSEDEDVLGNLEQALKANDTGRSRHHSRANSTTSITSHSSAKLKALMPVKDRAQEDILATLGVTGSPKMVYQTPGPAFGAPPQRDGSVSQNHSRASSVVSNPGPPRIPPPPPGQPLEYRRPSNHNGWNEPRPYRNGYNGSRPGSSGSWNNNVGRGNRSDHSGSRPGSSGSQRTAAGSDFGRVDADKTPRPPKHRTVSRKRSYQDYGTDQGHGRHGQDDDATPKQKQRFKAPRVDDVYARRW